VKKYVKSVLVFILLLFVALSATTAVQAQESAKLKDITRTAKRVAKAKISTNVTLGGNFQTGNTEKSGISGTVQISSVDSVKELSFNAKYTYSENKKVVNQREYLVGGQYDFNPLNRFSPFLRIELYGNEFKKIDYRVSGLIGAKYRYYVYKNTSDFSISGALLYDIENYIAEANLQTQKKYRLSLRPKFKQRIMENIYAQTELYYKPNITRLDDYIIHSITNVNFIINKNMFLRCSYEHEYNSKPAKSSVKKDDTLLLASLGINF
jgi:putative salt-induced outer membrane protein YdiY